MLLLVKWKSAINWKQRNCEIFICFNNFMLLSNQKQLTKLVSVSTKQQIKPMKIFAAGVILLSTIVVNILPIAAPVSAETMKDRCSSNVAFVPKYGDRPNAPGTIILTKGAATDWTAPFTVETGENGRIRWWCQSTTGNLFDPGTWRPELDSTKTATCVTGGVVLLFDSDSAAGKQAIKQCKGAVKTLGSSAWEGWTQERSRCKSKSGKIRARLDSNSRLLQIQCL
jgi:hypothetical protein